MGWTLRRKVAQNTKSNRVVEGDIIWRSDGHRVLSEMKSCWGFWAEMMFCFIINRIMLATVWTVGDSRKEVEAKKPIWNQWAVQVRDDLAFWVSGWVVLGYIEVLSFSECFMSHEISSVAWMEVSFGYYPKQLWTKLPTLAWNYLQLIAYDGKKHYKIWQKIIFQFYFHHFAYNSALSKNHLERKNISI